MPSVKNPSGWPLLANTVHVAAMGLWVGGLIALLSMWEENELVA